MRFVPTALAGVVRVQLELREDERGFFARTWCAQELAAQGLNPTLSQCSISYNHRRGTLRGMHYQAPPHQEAKLVRVTRGAIFDVALDLRPGSPTLGQWVGATLSADNHEALYLAEGLAHGFQTLSDDTEVLYQISTPYVAGAGRGVRWDDPAFGIQWPLAPTAINPRDQEWPPWQHPASS